MQTSKSSAPFLQRVRNAIPVRQYSIGTERADVDWIRRFILFHGKRHPKELGEADVGRFLTWLAVERNVAPSTQSQALNALVFLYRQLIDRSLGDITNAAPTKKPRRLPVVLTQDETKRLFRHLDGKQRFPGKTFGGYRGDRSEPRTPRSIFAHHSVGILCATRLRIKA